MSRSLTAGMIAELQKGTVSPALFVSVEFVSGFIYAWSGTGNVTWNGHTWQGVGSMGNISAITETGELAATNLTLSLSGIPSDLIGKALDECRINKTASVWFGFLDSSGNVIADPYQSFSGRVDVPQIDEGGKTSTISITVESCMNDLQRARGSRYTQDDQQLVSPGDLGFSFVPATQNWTAKWGAR